MHSSPVAVAAAPRGFRTRPDARVRRVTAAFGNPDADDLVIGAAGQAARVGATLRLASFAVRPRAPYTVAVGREADNAIVAEWTGGMEAAARAALEEVEELPVAPTQLEAVVGRGESWDEALDDVEWDEGDVLVVGSSSIGPVARVFPAPGRTSRARVARAGDRGPAPCGRRARRGGYGGLANSPP